MGSYHRITIAFVLIVCMVGLHVSAICRGDGTLCSKSPITPSYSPSTPQRAATSDNEMYTIVGSTIITIREEINKVLSPVTPTHQTPTTLTSAPESTNGTTSTTQNVTPTMVSSKASPVALVSQSVSTGLADVTGDIETGTTAGVGDGTGDEEMIQTTQSELMTNGVDVTTGPVRRDLEGEWTTLVNEILTSKLAIITEDITAITARDEFSTTTRDVPSPIEYVNITTVPTQEITRNDGTTDSDMGTMILATTLGKQATTQFVSTSETLTTSDHIPTQEVTRNDGTTDSDMGTTTLATTLGKQATTQFVSTPETLTTSDHIPTQEVTRNEGTTDSDMVTMTLKNQISANELSSEDLKNMVTLEFRNITEEVWFDLYDMLFREYLSTTLTSDTLRVRRDDIYYIEPSPLVLNDILYVSFIPTSSSAHKRSTMPGVPLNETLAALGNLTALREALGISLSQAPNISADLPDFIQEAIQEAIRAETSEEPLTTHKPPPTTQAETTEEPLTTRSTMSGVPLNETLAAVNNPTAFTEALGISLSQAPNISTDLPDFIQEAIQEAIQAETTEEPLTTGKPPTTRKPPTTIQAETTEEPLTTRKPPPTIGFLSNPGLFISLVVIATVSIIIIIVGLIYLLCDRRRGRSGEYITNHTPRNSDLELGFDNPVMAENDKAVSNGNHLSSIKGEMESDMIVPYDNFTQEELMNYEVEDTHL